MMVYQIQQLLTSGGNIPWGSYAFHYYSDALKVGWGAVCNGSKMGGHWTENETDSHSNELETLKLLFLP